MKNENKIAEIISKVKEIDEIKMEDVDAYNEYSVIVLYRDKTSDIIVCEDSNEVNRIYDIITRVFCEYQSLEQNCKSI